MILIISSIVIVQSVVLIWVIDLRHRMERLEKRFDQNRKWW